MVALMAALVVSLGLVCITVWARKSIMALEEDAPGDPGSFETHDYDLVSLLRRLEGDRQTLAVRLRFSRWLVFLLAPPAVGVMLRSLGSTYAILGFLLTWFIMAALDSGHGPWLSPVRSGPPWMFRMWVRLTEPWVRMGRSLQELRYQPLRTDPNLEMLFAESQASLSPVGGELGVEERRLLRKLLASTAILVSDIMTRWANVKTISLNTSRSELKDCFRESGRSRLPVKDDNRIVGMIRVKDALTALEEIPSAALVRPVFFVRRETVIQEVLDSLRNAREHLAVAVDPLGRPVGVVTIEDILEELVGELYDEREAPKEAAP